MNKEEKALYNPQLDTFIAVADSGSFSKASDSLYITPTAVIKQINLLENHLNLKLFYRTHRGLYLTEAGKSLYNDAKYMIHFSSEAVERAKNADFHGHSLIRIGTSPMTPAEILTQIWPQVHAFHPEIRFKLVPFENTPKNAREILTNLGRNIDMVAGIFDKNLLDASQCAGLVLKEEPICVAVSINHPLAKKEKLSVQDLYGQELLLLRRGRNAPVDQLRDDIGQKHPQIRIRDFDFYNTEIFNQCQNSGTCLMAIQSWQSIHPLLKILPVDWNYTIPFGILYARDPSPAVQACIDTLKKVYNV